MRDQITTATPNLYAFAAICDAADQKHIDALNMIVNEYPLVWDALFTHHMPDDIDALEAEASDATADVVDYLSR